MTLFESKINDEDDDVPVVHWRLTTKQIKSGTFHLWYSYALPILFVTIELENGTIYWIKAIQPQRLWLHINITPWVNITRRHYTDDSTIQVKITQILEFLTANFLDRQERYIMMREQVSELFTDWFELRHYSYLTKYFVPKARYYCLGSSVVLAK